MIQSTIDINIILTLGFNINYTVYFHISNAKEIKTPLISREKKFNIKENNNNKSNKQEIMQNNILIHIENKSK